MKMLPIVLKVVVFRGYNVFETAAGTMFDRLPASLLRTGSVIVLRGGDPFDGCGIVKRDGHTGRVLGRWYFAGFKEVASNLCETIFPNKFEVDDRIKIVLLDYPFTSSGYSFEPRLREVAGTFSANNRRRKVLRLTLDPKDQGVFFIQPKRRRAMSCRSK
jgi:hypothetical protein